MMFPWVHVARRRSSKDLTTRRDSKHPVQKAAGLIRGVGQVYFGGNSTTWDSATNGVTRRPIVTVESRLCFARFWLSIFAPLGAVVWLVDGFVIWLGPFHLSSRNRVSSIVAIVSAGHDVGAGARGTAPSDRPRTWALVGDCRHLVASPPRQPHAFLSRSLRWLWQRARSLPAAPIRTDM